MYDDTNNKENVQDESIPRNKELDDELRIVELHFDPEILEHLCEMIRAGSLGLDSTELLYILTSMPFQEEDWALSDRVLDAVLGEGLGQDFDGDDDREKDLETGSEESLD